MFADSFLFQLLVFVVVQATALALLRTGMLVAGFTLLGGSWLLADAALMLRFLLHDPDTTRLCLVGLQAMAVLGGGGFALWRVVRGRPGFRARPEEQWRRALDAYMAGRDQEAVSLLARLRRRDPWDAEACLLAARIEVDGGRPGPARRLLARAARLGVDTPLTPEIEEEQRCLRRPNRPSPAPLPSPKARATGRAAAV
ncbi:MAG: hypothetical protein R3F30_11795 [Planctomycetota bacterium]